MQFLYVLLCIVLVIAYFALIFGTINEAVKKGRYSLTWVICAILFNPFAYFAIHAATENTEELNKIGLKSRELMKCKACHEVVSARASVCKYCGNTHS